MKSQENSILGFFAILGQTGIFLENPILSLFSVSTFYRLTKFLKREINPFITGKIEKLDLWDSNNSTNFKDH